MSQIQRYCLVLLLFLGNGWGFVSSHAQFTANFQTNIISGGTSNWAGNYVVGSNTFANTLLIRNGGVLCNADGYLGYLPSSSNSAIVTGIGSIWSNSGSYLNIGHGASYNKMIVNGGGRVYGWHARIGSGNASTGNSVLISDSGSLWDVSEITSALAVGFNGSGNSLTVSNGGGVNAYMGYIGRHGGNNRALVTGTNSTWTVNCYTYVGFEGSSNTMTLADGARATNKFIYISHEVGSSNNTLLATGPNTSWHNENSVFVGFSGGSGSLTISNGATMSVGGAWGVSHDGALGVDPTSSNNRALVTGGGSVWNCADNMYVGLNGPGNSLVISNGGRVIDIEGYVGSNSGSDNNRAWVVGDNSVWTNASDFHVGLASTNNQLIISNGGWVIDRDGVVGRYSDSSRNRVIVTGPNSVWRNKTNLYVGCFGASNSLVISNAARVFDVYGYIGHGSDSHNNHVSVSGTGSMWTNSYATLVGNFGSSNTLTIRDGGLVSDYWGVMGDEEESIDNTVYVEAGGTWRTQRLLVGHQGSHNALYVNGGAVFAGTSMDVGFDPVYPNNLAQLNSGEINVTNAAHNAVLEVYGGSFVLLGGILRVDTLIVTNAGAQFVAMGGTLSYRALQLTPGFDVDTDGVPNGWEQMYGFSPLDPFDAGNDSDGDGMSNLEEYRAGTNPTNAASCLQITSQTISNHSFNVSWKAVGGKSYVIQKSPSPTAGFTDLSPVITIPGTAEITTNYLDVGAATNWAGRFYRIRLEP